MDCRWPPARECRRFSLQWRPGSGKVGPAGHFGVPDHGYVADLFAHRGHAAAGQQPVLAAAVADLHFGPVRARNAGLLASFAFALTVLRSVRNEGSGNTAFVPEISVTVAFGLAIASVIALGALPGPSHPGNPGRDHDAQRQRRNPRNHRPGLPGGPARVLARSGPTSGTFLIEFRSSGFLTSLDQGALLKAAKDSGAVVRVDRKPGSPPVQGVPFATAWPAEPEEY